MELKKIITYKTPKDLKELKERITAFFSLYTMESLIQQPVSPRLFRISLGVSKQALSYWKTSKERKPWYDLIKTHEDVLLGFIEQKTLDISNKQVIGLINTLRAYDRELYIPELASNQQREERKPIVIQATNSSSNKILLLNDKEK